MGVRMPREFVAKPWQTLLSLDSPQQWGDWVRARNCSELGGFTGDPTARYRRTRYGGGTIYRVRPLKSEQLRVPRGLCETTTQP